MRAAAAVERGTKERLIWQLSQEKKGTTAPQKGLNERRETGKLEPPAGVLLYDHTPPASSMSEEEEEEAFFLNDVFSAINI